MRRGITAVPTAERPAVPPSDRHDGTPSIWSKYTVKFRHEDAATFDALALRCRRRLNRRVDKSEIVTVLIRLAADDAALAEQLVAELDQ